MKKAVLLLLIQVLTCQAFSDSSNHLNIGKAAKQGRTNAAAIVWSIAGISLLITIGVITAIVIQNEK